MILKGSSGSSIDSWEGRQKFLRGLTLKLSDALKISPLRLNIYSVTSGEGQLYVRGSIVEKEKAQSFFQINQDRNPKGHSHSPYTYHNSSNSPSLCADYCTGEVKRPFEKSGFCFGFAFKRDTMDCNFYFNYFRPQKDNLEVDYWTDFYERVRSEYFDKVSMAAAFSDLQTQVNAGKIQLTGDTGTVFTASSVEKTNINKDKALGSGFYQTNHVTLLGHPVEVLSGYTRGACSRQCLNSQKYDCEAFMYDIIRMRCSLYSDRQWKYQKKTSTTVYFRQYANSFDAMPGLSALKKSSHIYMNTYNVHSCAKLCLNSKAFSCESFELCGPTCMLGSKHFFDIPKEKIEKDYNCVHYSKRYIQDYNIVQKKKALKNSHVVELKNLGVKNCAKICSTSSDYECDVFEYCAIAMTCRVTTKAMLNTDNLAYQSTGDCDLYTRKKGLPRSVLYQASTQSSGHSAGAMGGLAFGMIFLGVIVVLVVTVLFLKVKSKGKVNFSPYIFSKKKLEEEG